MSGESLLVVESVSKRYGETLAVDGVSLRVGAGEVYALVGANGAGKSTLIRMMTGLSEPDSGAVVVCGEEMRRHPHAAKRHVGYLPEELYFYQRLTGREYLRLVAVARLFFYNIAHLQASWLTTGKDVGQVALHLGVDDLGSIMLEENVISSAGARHRSNLLELVHMIRSAGRIPAQRDTLYRHLKVHLTPADDPTDERVVSHFSSIAMPGGGAGRPQLPLVEATPAS